VFLPVIGANIGFFAISWTFSTLFLEKSTLKMQEWPRNAEKRPFDLHLRCKDNQFCGLADDFDNVVDAE
jgi:hypothetical protein